jgi:hypothetical protein
VSDKSFVAKVLRGPYHVTGGLARREFVFDSINVGEYGLDFGHEMIARKCLQRVLDFGFESFSVSLSREWTSPPVRTLALCVGMRITEQLFHLPGAVSKYHAVGISLGSDCSGILLAFEDRP